MAEEKKDKKSVKTKRPTAQKRALQSERKRLLNKAAKAKVNTAIKQFQDHLTKGTAQEIKQSLNSVFSLMDKGVKKNLFKLSKASRVKKRLSKKVKA